MLKLSCSYDSVRFVKIWIEWIINYYILCHFSMPNHVYYHCWSRSRRSRSLIALRLRLWPKDVAPCGSSSGSATLALTHHHSPLIYTLYPPSTHSFPLYPLSNHSHPILCPSSAHPLPIFYPPLLTLYSSSSPSSYPLPTLYLPSSHPLPTLCTPSTLGWVEGGYRVSRRWLEVG
jgi:hypothetical protein